MSYVIEGDIEREIHRCASVWLFDCGVARFIRLFFVAHIHVLSGLLLIRCLTAFEVEDVVFNCTERVIVTYIEPICILSSL